MKKILLSGLLFILLFGSSFAQTLVFPFGSSWKYLANGSNQGTAWISPSFNDVSWPSGPGQLGYGDGDEATLVGYGPDANAKYITTYFRKTISVANPGLYSSFTLYLKRDDGIVVYLNGSEIIRDNVAAGTVTYTTLAALASDDGATAQTFYISPAAFSAGNNTISVEIHQNAGTSSDISFDMELLATPLPANALLVSYGSIWKYKDDGSNQGTAWQTTAFNDAAWASGAAQLGYGDGDEATVVNFGSNPNAKPITTYFRKTITVADTSSFSGYTLNLKRDDGAVVYLNGTEVYRTNMPASAISYLSLASTNCTDDGNTAQTKALRLNQIKKGTNVIAVEIHQNAANGADLSFDLELRAILKTDPTAALTRGPYLNKAMQTGVVLRWRTNLATNSQVSFGTAANPLTRNVTDNVLTTEHIVTLTGLLANTKYFYNFGSTTQILQGDASNYFKTLPASSSTQKVRFLAMGDMGNNSTNQVNVRNAWLSFNGTNYTDGWILLGDNAYNSGTDAEYQTNFYNIYQGNMTKNHVLWPAPGNHDYANTAARQADHAIPYYDMFTLPKSGEAGGVASNTEAYYSFNYANIHFVALDSYGWETGSTRLYDTLGPQAVWLKQDLAANTKLWTIAFFHHPPYTKTSHNSDAEPELVNIRQKLVPILERYKVDLVLNGHSHGYERSYLLHGHYGLENTFSQSANAVSNSSAKYDGSTNSCTYIKNAAEVRNGIVYAVIGSAGQLGGSSPGYPHDAMYYSNNTDGGALYFEVENNRLNAKWVCGDGLVRDNFTIMKNVNKTSNISLNVGSNATLTASWIGKYAWSTGAVSRSIVVAPTTSKSYTVADGSGCLADVFNISVVVPKPGTGPGSLSEYPLRIYPSLLKAGDLLRVEEGANEEEEYAVFDSYGKKWKHGVLKGNLEIDTKNLPRGGYVIRVKYGNSRFFITD